MKQIYINIIIIIVIFVFTFWIFVFPPSYKYIVSSENNFFESQNFKIPKVIYQTYIDKSKIPPKVYKNIKDMAPFCVHKVFDDIDIINFLNTEFGSEYVNVFNSFKLGAHKADFFRYCILYLYGGVYIDIKTKLLVPLHTFVNFKDLKTPVITSVKSIKHNSIYQGFIATSPKCPLFLELIDYMIHVAPYSIWLKFNYLFTTKHFFQLIHKNTYKKIYFNLLIEQNNNVKECEEKLDRYGYCVFGIEPKSGKKILQIRYADYPW